MAYRGTMKYFIMTNRGNNPFPQIINWSQVLDVRKMNREEYKTLPPFLMLDMKFGMDAFFPDIILSPFLLISRTVMEVVALYDPSMPFYFTALFDIEQGNSGAYYCPILEVEACVAEQPQRNNKRILLDRENMAGLPLFQMKIRGERKNVIRIDLVESLLEREAVGIELEEVDMTE